MTMRQRTWALAATFILAAMTVATAYLEIPTAPRTALGLLIVFFLPGFAAVPALLPERTLNVSERLLASLGISLAVATCASVLLAATPLGLSRASLAVLLGGTTMALSAVALLRSRRAPELRTVDHAAQERGSRP